MKGKKLVCRAELLHTRLAFVFVKVRVLPFLLLVVQSAPECEDEAGTADLSLAAAIAKRSAVSNPPPPSPADLDLEAADGVSVGLPEASLPVPPGPHSDGTQQQVGLYTYFHALLY